MAQLARLRLFGRGHKNSAPEVISPPNRPGRLPSRSISRKAIGAARGRGGSVREIIPKGRPHPATPGQSGLADSARHNDRLESGAGRFSPAPRRYRAECR